MKHFTIHRLSKTQLSLLPKVSDRQYCGNLDSAVYYYHGDHLGSASWITNGSGTPVQHLQYMPYGEPLVNERTSSYEERSYSPLLHYHYVSTSLTVQIPNGNAIANLLNLLHTGKERDSETGFSYFGAGKIFQNILLIALLCIGLNANAKIDMNNKIVLCNASNVVLCNEVCEKDSVSSFFNRFCADSNFQYSRVIFPVKCTTKMDAYDEPDIEEIIEKKNWKYTNFLNLPTNRLIEIERVNKTTFKLNLQIEDTGVYVDYLFELIDCKWYLVKIINAST